MKRALLIGIDKYKHLGHVKGCVNDAKALEQLLAKHWDGSRNFDCRKPLVPIDHLRQLADLFPSAMDEYPLDPTYEPESPTRVTDKVGVYEVLARCSYANLVEPVGAAYLYHAAMESKSCRLTPHGRHYCELVGKDLLPERACIAVDDSSR